LDFVSFSRLPKAVETCGGDVYRPLLQQYWGAFSIVDRTYPAVFVGETSDAVRLALPSDGEPVTL